MAWTVTHQAATGGTYYVTIRKLDSTFTNWWFFTSSVWSISALPAAGHFEELSETPAGGGSYVLELTDTFASYTGLVLIEIWDANDGTGCQTQYMKYMRAGVVQWVPAPLSTVLVVDADKTWTAKPGTTANQIVLADAAYNGLFAMDMEPCLNPGTTLDSDVTPTITDTSGNGLVAADILVAQDRKHVHFTAATIVAGTDNTMQVIATGTDGNPCVSTGRLRGT